LKVITGKGKEVFKKYENNPPPPSLTSKIGGGAYGGECRGITNNKRGSKGKFLGSQRNQDQAKSGLTTKGEGMTDLRGCSELPYS